MMSGVALTLWNISKRDIHARNNQDVNDETEEQNNDNSICLFALTMFQELVEVLYIYYFTSMRKLSRGS